ncbi:MAG: DNA polymerase III subunit delta' [Candidatus Hydrogenedentota bacterium]|nr:MAG: DNA polymerase III subunit delta' [Candidatus Hydrogenedentota bacterium]
MSFHKILDQSTAVRTLQSAVDKKRVAHAYIFIGPSGVGRKLTATILAKSLNCERFREQNPCGVCANCCLIAEGKHPDVQIIMPTKRSSTITVDQIEDLIPFAYMRPIRGKFKVFVLSEADRLGIGTANKLLKTLEEPPPFTVFVLITEKPESVLPTVASRCQPIKFGRLRAESVARILVTDFHVDSQRAALAAQLASGQVTRGLEFADPKRLDTVLSIVDSSESFPARMAAYERLLEFFAEQRELLQEQAEREISGFGEDLDSAMKASIDDLRKSFVDRHYRNFLTDCLGLLLTFYRDILVLKQTNAEELIINRNKIGLLGHRAKTMSLSAIMQNMKDIEEASEYCSHYVSEDRVFMDLLLRLRNG